MPMAMVCMEVQSKDEKTFGMNFSSPQVGGVFVGKVKYNLDTLQLLVFKANTAQK